jgi:imidazoleglycerol-phosphate dehydratase
MRKATVNRKTKETEINLYLALEGSGDVEVSTEIGFFDHMLSLLAYHAGCDLKLEARGDLQVDQHHTVEDVGLCLGKALKDALGDKAGIQRYGWAITPMDEALSMIAMDISGRPHLSYDVELPVRLISDFDPTCVREFLLAIAREGAITLHVKSLDGTNPHHVLEAVFKGLGRALRQAVRLDSDRLDIPSSKGTL